MKVFLVVLVVLVSNAYAMVHSNNHVGSRPPAPHLHLDQPPEESRVKGDILLRTGPFDPSEQQPVDLLKLFSDS